MDNLIQKNIILGDQEVTERPYLLKDNVQLPNPRLQNFPDTYEVDLNNSFHQMVDNDLYNENKIVRLAGYKEGLKPGDPQSVLDGPDGYKFARDEDGILEIYRKIQVPIQETLSSVQSLLSVNCTSLEEMNGLVFVGTDQGTYAFRRDSLWPTGKNPDEDDYFLSKTSIEDPGRIAYEYLEGQEEVSLDIPCRQAAQNGGNLYIGGRNGLFGLSSGQGGGSAF